jgi:ubiquinone/menaquinone biosynthesis C-methylase UbiE
LTKRVEQTETRATDSGKAFDRQEVYSVGYDCATAGFFSDRRAATHAAFFLPHLKSGMTLLDCGCGPGTITVDFAGVVSPAQVIGIDIERSQINLARAQATKRGTSNLCFGVASLYELPFSDESFDAAFLHGVLEHLRAPVAALREVRRVLKRGGVLGARHADFGGFILEPAPPPLDQFAPLFEQLMRHNGGDPKAGRHQLRWLRESGFDRIEVSASYDCWTRTPDDRRRNARFLASLVGDSDFAVQLLETGIADKSTLAEMSKAFLDWSADPNAFAAEAWSEAVAWKE